MLSSCYLNHLQPSGEMRTAVCNVLPLCVLPIQFVFCTPHPTRDQIEKNGMGGACSAYGREGSRMQGFGGET